MKKKQLSLIVLLLFVALVLMVSDISARTPYMPDEAHQVSNFLNSCRLGKPIKYDNLTIIPVTAGFSKELKVITLDEAIKEKSLTVKEVTESGSVNSLAVWNNSDKFVFLMAGEILEGAKQDRVLQEDVLLPPDSGRIVINVYCVDQHRWTYKSDKFYSSGKNANISVRQTAQQSKSQGAVWESVAGTNASVGAPCATDTLAKSYDAPEVAKSRDKYVIYFTEVPVSYPDANGVIVLVNNKVLAADIFADKKVFKKLWKKLIDSYIIEAISRKGKDVPSDISSAREFLREMIGSKIALSDTTGTGRKFELVSNAITGQGVVKSGSTIHIAAFPKIKDVEIYKPDNRLQRHYNSQTSDQQQIINVPPNTNVQIHR